MLPAKPFHPFVVHRHPASCNSSHQQSEVFYIPAVPFCEKNRVYVQAQAAMERHESRGGRSTSKWISSWADQLVLMFKLVYDILIWILNQKNLQLYKTHGNSFGSFLKKTPSVQKDHCQNRLVCFRMRSCLNPVLHETFARLKPSSSIARHQIFLPTTVRFFANEKRQVFPYKW